MNTQTSRTTRVAVSAGSRAQLSPLFRRSTQDALARGQIAARLNHRTNRASALPLNDPLTPATPTLSDRWWDPHLLDRLQTPLSRIRE